jgi:hypothetical protein
MASVNKPMKGRPGPISDSRYVSMFEGVPVYVINASLQIFFVPDRVFPKPSLPNGSFSFAAARSIAHTFLPAGFEISLRKFLFELLPPQRIVGVASR